jgi:hypothetical protein
VLFGSYYDKLEKKLRSYYYLNSENILHTSIFITFVVTFKLLVTHQVFRYTFLTCYTLELIVGTFTCKYNKVNTWSKGRQNSLISVLAYISV